MGDRARADGEHGSGGSLRSGGDTSIYRFGLGLHLVKLTCDWAYELWSWVGCTC